MLNKKLLILGLITIGAISLMACNKSSIKTEKTEENTNQNKKEDILLKKNNIIDTFKDNKNVVISDTSIKMALSMLMEGSSGETLKELEDYYGINIEELSKKNLNLIKNYDSLDFTDLNIANSFWNDKDINIKDNFIKTLQEKYNAEVKNIDFKDGQSAEIINNWCSDKTKQLIPEIVSQDTMKGLKTLLINALYFNGTWQEPFLKENTKKENFTNIDNNVVSIDMMNGKVDSYIENDNATGFIKPYAEGIVFIGILPKQDDLNLENINIKELIDSSSNEYDVMIKIPKIKVEFESSLKDSLIDVGISNIFSDNAEFKKISDDGLTVDDIIHKTYIDINEEGTEAAAVTSVQMRTTSIEMPKQQKEVFLNKPFLFTIYDTVNEEFLFTGKINNLK